MDIVTKTGALRARTEGWSYSGTFMGERSLTCEVASPVPVEFGTGDYTLLAVRDGMQERFELEGLPTVKKVASTGSYGDAYHYTLRLVPLQNELQRCVMNDLVRGGSADGRLYTGQSVWSTYGTARELADRILANLDRLYKGADAWTIEVRQEGEAAELSFDNTTCWDALQMVQTVFGLKFTLLGRHITIGSLGEQIGHTFRYGSGGGIYDLTRTADEATPVVTRLKAYGAERNLPADYCRQPGDDSRLITRLMLPAYRTDGTDYIESEQVARYGIREGVQHFEHIYPTIEGMTGEELRAAGVITSATGRVDEIVSMSPVAQPDQAECTVRIKDPGFDLSGCLEAGETPVMALRDGWLGGREFEIAACRRSGDGYALTLRRIEDAGLYLPDNTLRLRAGDRFVLLGCSMPAAYVLAAEQRLLTQARAYLAAHDHTPVSYTLTIDNVGMARIPATAALLAEGNLMHVVDEDLGIDERIPIQGITIREGTGGIREYSVTLAQEAVPTRLGLIDQALRTQHVVLARAQAERTREARRTTSGISTLRQALFDPDGQVQQEFLRSMMMQVGADSMNYRMDRTRWRDGAGENLSFTDRTITLGGDALRHFSFGIASEAASDWVVEPLTRDDLDPVKLYYVAVKACTDRPEAVWEVSENSCGVRDQPGYYIFQFGLLAPISDGVRTFTETRGMSTLYGDNLTVGRIRSLDGRSYFDLTTGELCVGGNNARIDKYDFLAESFAPDDSTEVQGGVVLSNFIGVKKGSNIQAGMTNGTYRSGDRQTQVPLLFAGASNLARAEEALFTISDSGRLISRGQDKSIRLENGRLSLCDSGEHEQVIFDAETKPVATGNNALGNVMSSRSGRGSIPLLATVTLFDGKPALPLYPNTNYIFAGTQPLSGAFTVGEHCTITVPELRFQGTSNFRGSFCLDYLNLELCQQDRVVASQPILGCFCTANNRPDLATMPVTFSGVQKGTYTLRLSLKGYFMLNLPLQTIPSATQSDPVDGPSAGRPEADSATQDDAVPPYASAAKSAEPGSGTGADNGSDSSPRMGIDPIPYVPTLRIVVVRTTPSADFVWEERVDQATLFNNGLLFARAADNYVGLIIDDRQALLEHRSGTSGFRLSSTGQFVWRNNQWQPLGGGSSGTGNVTAAASLAAGQIVVGAGSAGIRTDGKTIATTLANNAAAIPTSAAVYTYLSGRTTSSITSGSTLWPTGAAVYNYAAKQVGVFSRGSLVMATDTHAIGTPVPRYIQHAIGEQEEDHANVPTAQAVKEYVAAQLRGTGGEWYTIQLHKSGQELSTIIETTDVPAEMTDTSKYRMVLFRFRKHAEEGRRWRIPMLPYEHKLHRNPKAEVHSAIPHNRTFWRIDGVKTRWWNAEAGLAQVLPLRSDTLNQRWSNSNNRKMRVGAAICKYTGQGPGMGWQRVSNIAAVDLYLYKFTEPIGYHINPVP